MKDQPPWGTGFVPSLLAHDEVVPQIRPWQIPSTSVLTHYTVIISPIHGIQYQIPTGVNNYRLLQHSTQTWNVKWKSHSTKCNVYDGRRIRNVNTLPINSYFLPDSSVYSQAQRRVLRDNGTSGENIQDDFARGPKLLNKQLPRKSTCKYSTSLSIN